MRHEALVVTDMTRQTAPGARVGPLCWNHSLVDILLMVATRNMNPEPLNRAAVTGLATDAVRQIELWSLPILWDIVCVAIEAQRLVFRMIGFFQKPREITRDTPSLLAQQRGIGLAMLVRLLPGQILILLPSYPGERLDPAVAIVAGAAGDAEMRAVVGRNLRH